MSDLTIDKLGNAIQDFLSSQYPSVAGATSVFAAQPGGLPVDTSAFASNLLLANQEINDLADITARVIAGQFWPTLIKASGLYEILLSGMPTDGMTGDQLAQYGQLRGNADENFHNQLAGINTLPSNWWDLTANNNWTTHTTSSDEVTGTPTLPPWNWHVLPPQHLPILSGGFHPGSFPIDRALSIASVRSSLSATTLSTTPISSTPAFTASRMEMAFPARVAVQSLTPSSNLNVPITKPISMVASSRAIEQLVSVASIQTVEAEHISISFEFCLVILSRPWWDGLFVATKGWYIPTYGTGDLAVGTANGSEGQCPAIPTAMFLVRNVAISGSWSDQDRVAIPNAASFGPISLIGRSIDSSLTISIPGMQIVGWMADILPTLPPMSDPNLGTLGLQSTNGGLDALPTLANGQQGPVVARLQGLLRAATPGSSDTSLAIDGNFGPATLSAVQTFQHQNGLNATGLVDITTWQKLLGLS